MRAEGQTDSPGETPGGSTGSGPTSAWRSPGVCHLPSPALWHIAWRRPPRRAPRPQARAPALALVSCPSPPHSPRSPLTGMGLSGHHGGSSRAAVAHAAPGGRGDAGLTEMGLGWGAGGHEEESDQGGCGDLHGAAGAQGSASGAGAGGAAGLSSARCSAPLAGPSFYPRPLGGHRVSRKENESIILRKLCQDRPDLLSWRRQGNRRRGSAATRLRLSDSIWVPVGDPAQHKPPRHPPCRCWKEPTGHQPGRGTKPRGRSPEGNPKQVAVERHQRAPGSHSLCKGPSSSPVPGAAELLRGRTALPGSGAVAWTPPGTAAIAGQKPLPGVQSRLSPGFATNTAARPAAPLTAGTQSYSRSPGGNQAYEGYSSLPSPNHLCFQFLLAFKVIETSDRPVRSKFLLRHPHCCCSGLMGSRGCGRIFPMRRGDSRGPGAPRHK